MTFALFSIQEESRAKLQTFGYEYLISLDEQPLNVSLISCKGFTTNIPVDNNDNT